MTSLQIANSAVGDSSPLHESHISRSSSSTERDRAIDFPIVGQRVHVVIGGDTLRVAQQLGNVSERARALVVQRAAPPTQTVRREVRCPRRLARSLDRDAQRRVAQLREERRVELAVLARRQRRDERGEQIAGQLERAIALGRTLWPSRDDRRKRVGVGKWAERPIAIVVLIVERSSSAAP
jgi:hypothetical protein